MKLFLCDLISSELSYIGRECGRQAKAHWGLTKISRTYWWQNFYEYKPTYFQYHRHKYGRIYIRSDHQGIYLINLVNLKDTPSSNRLYFLCECAHWEHFSRTKYWVALCHSEQKEIKRVERPRNVAHSEGNLEDMRLWSRGNTLHSNECSHKQVLRGHTTEELSASNKELTAATVLYVRSISSSP